MRIRSCHRTHPCSVNGYSTCSVVCTDVTQVLWSKRDFDADPEVSTVGEQRENVDGQHLQFLIPGLDPDTTYLVQVSLTSSIRRCF